MIQTRTIGVDWDCPWQTVSYGRPNFDNFYSYLVFLPSWAQGRLTSQLPMQFNGTRWLPPGNEKWVTMGWSCGELMHDHQGFLIPQCSHQHGNMFQMGDYKLQDGDAFVILGPLVHINIYIHTHTEESPSEKPFWKHKIHEKYIFCYCCFKTLKIKNCFCHIAYPITF